MKGELRLNDWLSIGLFLTLVGISAAAEPPASEPLLRQAPRIPELLSLELAEDDPENDELRKLLKARYECAGSTMRQASANFRTGRLGIRDWNEVVRDWVTSGLELSDDPAERAAILSYLVQHMKWAEKLVEARRAIGTCAPYELDRARYLRLDAEIKLLRAEREVIESKKKY